jgi:hypothetical protein
MPFVPDPCRLALNPVTFTATTVFSVLSGVRPELGILGAGQFGAANLSSKALIPGSDIPDAPNKFSLTFRGHEIGLDVVSLANLGAPITLEFTEANGTLTSSTLFAANTGTFIGATSTIGFTQLSLYDPPGRDCCINFVIDNVALEPVPELSTLLLFGTSAAGLGLAARRRRRHS